ncbi:MAG: YeiH family protein, partial [Bacteroidota bacterium]
YGLGYALWAILIGLIISNTVGTPEWVKPAALTEYYIKTGLVLLGVEVLFGKIIQIGIPGLVVAWVVTPVVIIISFIFGKRFVKLPSDELNITMSSAVSVCGVSAAIATAAACKAKKEELTLAVGLSLIFTAIMMVLMPAFIKAVGMTEILGGAWMGGVIDSTGAVAAAGAFLGEKALYVAATIKMIQNILIGVVAFFVAIYWTMKMDRAAGGKPSAMEIWYRFPKFVIGFALASVASSVLSYALGPDQSYTLLDHGIIGGFTKDLRGWMFCLAFVSIGLSTNFRELRSYFRGGKPLTLYVFGQTFNLLLTLLIAWIAFYLLFPAITEAI